MKKHGFKAILALTVSLIGAVIFAVHAFAMTPTLTLTNNGYGSLQISVYGDANMPVIFDYYANGQLLGAGVVGYTNYSGSYSGTLNENNYYNIPNGAQVVVVVNGQQSNTALWQSNGNYYGNGTGGTLSLSQSSVTLSVGQSVTITSYNSGNGTLYVSNNSNSGIANVSAYSNQVTVTGESYGSATINICSTYNGCASLYVNVSSNGGYNNNGTVSLSQTNANLNVGQSLSIYINGTYNNGYTNQYYLSSNLSSGIVSATLNGNVLTLYGQNAGSTTVTVCPSSNGSYYTYNNVGCASVYITVTGSAYYPSYPTYPTYPTYPSYPSYPYNNYSYPINLVPSSVQVSVGSTATVTINGEYNDDSYYGSNYGYNNSNYYISNGTSGIASATINGNVITIYGTAAGTTSINVCGTNNNGCATVSVTVTSPYIYNGGYYNYNNGYPPNNNGNWYWNSNQNCWSER